MDGLDLAELRGSSIEKCDALVQVALTSEPTTPQAAMLLGLAGTLLPQLRGMLPTDPDELDAHLLAGAAFLLAMRSDAADARSIVGPTFAPAQLDAGDGVDLTPDQLDANASGDAWQAVEPVERGPWGGGE